MPATKAYKLNTESERIEGSGQAMDYTGHFTLIQNGVKKLRVRIHLDTYVSQAWGAVQVWSNDQWNDVASVRGDGLGMDRGLGYRQLTANQKLQAFQYDRDRLINLALEILLT